MCFRNYAHRFFLVCDFSCLHFWWLVFVVFWIATGMNPLKFTSQCIRVWWGTFTFRVISKDWRNTDLHWIGRFKNSNSLFSKASFEKISQTTKLCERESGSVKARIDSKNGGSYPGIIRPSSQFWVLKIVGIPHPIKYVVSCHDVDLPAKGKSCIEFLITW